MGQHTVDVAIFGADCLECHAFYISVFAFWVSKMLSIICIAGKVLDIMDRFRVTMNKIKITQGFPRQIQSSVGFVHHDQV